MGGSNLKKLEKTTSAAVGRAKIDDFSYVFMHILKKSEKISSAAVGRAKN